MRSVDLLTWLRRNLLDLAAGMTALLASAFAFAVVFGFFWLLFGGPTWIQLPSITLACMAALIAWGRILRPRPRRDRIPPPPRDPPAAGLRHAVFTERSRRVSELDARWATKTDEELRAQGILNPASMRCMGFSRYCAVQARNRPEVTLVDCSRCGVGTAIPHQSMFCTRTGISYPSVHWCCPGLGECELNDPAVLRAHLANAGRLPCDRCPRGCPFCLACNLCACPDHPLSEESR